MADDITLNAGAGGAVLATDDIASVHYQKVKLVDGTDQGTGLIGGDAANGLDVDVTRLPALVAGTANIGDVDVLTVITGTGATNLGKAVDGVAGVTDTGGAPLAVRDDALGALTPVEGDYVQLRTDANGALWTHDDALDAALAGGELQVDVGAALPAGDNNIGNVDIVTVPAPLSTAGGGAEATALRVTIASDSTGVVSVDDNAGALTVDNTGTFVTQVDGAALTALQLIDNLVLLEDAAHVTADPGIQMLAVRDDTLNVRSGAENDYEPLHTDANGALWAQDVNSAAIAASLSVLDDWDETNRAAVNTIAGQAGVQGGSGVTNAPTPRVVLATDVALPAGTNGIGKLTANSGVDIGDVDVLSIAAGANLIGDVGLQPRTTGGLSFFKTIDLDETEEAGKATAG